jgi:hypothetical protein
MRFKDFILFQEGKPTHLFFATMDRAGGGGFNNSARSSNMVIALKN